MLLVLLSFVAKTTRVLATTSCNSSIKDVQPHIGVLVSPIISEKLIHEIEIYWNNLNHRTGDRIALYAEKPRSDSEPIYTVQLKSSNGIQKTGIQADFVPTANLTFTPECLKYHVVWLRNGAVQKANCLMTQPKWMQERRDTLGSLMMSKVFVPGTHNSAAYALHQKPGIESFIQMYAITQDIDVLSQLIHGVRYLDIRVGYYPITKEVWWTNHGIYRSVPLQKVIDDVKTFLDNTEEIVIFDIQEFPVGFGKNLTTHRNFVTHLEKEFKGYLLPKNYGWTTALNLIWSSGKRLIIGYDNSRVVSESEYMWPCVTHQWGNVRNIRDLFDYLNRIEKSYRGVNRLTPRSAMAELTPTTFDVILNNLGGLRRMADNININITNWYRDMWQDSANIVAVDFLRGTGIVETAIEANDKRFLYCQLKES